MRTATFFCFTLGLALSFMACKNTPTSEKKDPSVSTPVSEGKNYFSKHLKGTIGAFPVTMDLVKIRNVYDDSPQLQGYYSYEKYQQPLPIHGFLDATGNVKLEEPGREGSTAVFQGKFNPDGSFVGTWTDTLKKVSYPFSLREAAEDGALSFDFFPFEDSTKLFQNVKNSPQATYSMDMLLPAKNTEGSVFEFLRTHIIKQLRHDSLMGNYANLQISDVQKTARDSFFKDYKEQLKEEKPDTVENHLLNYAESQSMEVISNTDGLLSLGFRRYNYSGGAHGNYGTQLMTYDIKNKKVVMLNDLFKPNYKAVLSAALSRSARQYLGIKPNASLEGHLFAKPEPNDNFMVNKKGILFNYTPYEIASYAQGEIQLFVLFDELKTILK